MKNKFIIAFLTVATLLFAFSEPARAQTSIPCKTYSLTNSIFNYANGSTNITGSGSITLNSSPFPIWRGRGLALHSGIYGTNAGTDNITFTIQTATPYTFGGVTYTNWSTAGSATAVVAMNGTTEVMGYTLIPPTTLDNTTLGRVSTVASAHASSIWLDPTNTFVSVYP